MGNLHLSKSKYCNAVQCPKMLWLKKNRPEEFDDSVMDYQNLEGVHNGDEAMNTFARMAHMNPDELEEWRGYLLKYCEKDTLAMVNILEMLKEV